MRLLICIVIVQFAMNAMAQDQPRVDPLGFHFEFGVLPLVIYNQANIGLSFRTTERDEHSLELNPQIWHNTNPDGDGFRWFNSFGIMYSYNRTFKRKAKSRLYIPMWVKSRRIIAARPSYDGGSTESMLNSIGTGIGFKRLFKNGNGLKIEFHLGVGMINDWDNSDPKFYPSNSRQGFDSLFDGGMSQVDIIPVPRLKIRYTLPFNTSKL